MEGIWESEFCFGNTGDQWEVWDGREACTEGEVSRSRKAEPRGEF